MWPVQFRPGLSRKGYGGWGGKATSDDKNWFELLSGTAVFARFAWHYLQGEVIYIRHKCQRHHLDIVNVVVAKTKH